MEPFIIGPDEGRRYLLGGGEVVIKAMPEHARIGAFSVETFPPGFSSPLHVHHRDDGVFYLLDGRMRIKCGEVDAIAGPGATVFLPRGVPHAFRVEGDASASWFNVQAPHGDFMLRAMQASGDAPAGSPGEDGHIEIVGPPPFD